MFKITPLTAGLAQQLGSQADAFGDPLEERASVALQIAQEEPVWALIEAGQVIGALAVSQVLPHRAIGWALFAGRAAEHPVWLVRELRRALDGIGYARTEAYIDSQHVSACRLAGLLGFMQETPEPMPAFLPNGNAAFMFGRIATQRAPVVSLAPLRLQ